VGIGNVKIGMPIASVKSILGVPKNICRGTGGGNIDVYTWFETSDPCSFRPDSPGGLLVYTNPSGVVTGVQAYKDPRYFLGNGLRVGSDASLIRERMGGDPLVAIGLDGIEHLQYSALGISFHISGPTITSISVSMPGTK
jgi:hypothetical protein